MKRKEKKRSDRKAKKKLRKNKNGKESGKRVMIEIWPISIKIA